MGDLEYTVDIDDLQPMDTHYLALGSKFPCLVFTYLIQLIRTSDFKSAKIWIVSPFYVLSL